MLENSSLIGQDSWWTKLISREQSWLIIWLLVDCSPGKWWSHSVSSYWAEWLLLRSEKWVLYLISDIPPAPCNISHLTSLQIHFTHLARQEIHGSWGNIPATCITWRLSTNILFVNKTKYFRLCLSNEVSKERWRDKRKPRDSWEIAES